jgi:hypothetical protein
METTMKKLRLSFMSLVLMVVLTACAKGGVFHTKLSGAEEVPPVETIATGNALFVVHKGGTELHYRLEVKDFENVTQAHIHVGMPGENGPVVLFLYPSAPPAVLIPGPFNGVLGQGTATTTDLRGPLAGQPISALVALLESGDAYVNVHTSQFPGGEIRGQVD